MPERIAFEFVLALPLLAAFKRMMSLMSTLKPGDDPMLGFCEVSDPHLYATPQRWIFTQVVVVVVVVDADAWYVDVTLTYLKPEQSNSVSIPAVKIAAGGASIEL